MAERKAREKVGSKTELELRRELDDFVAICPDLDGVDVRVYIYLSGRLNFKEPVHVPQVEMAVILGRQQTHISRSLRKLMTVGLLLPGPDGTRASKWILNRDFDK